MKIYSSYNFIILFLFISINAIKSQTPAYPFPIQYFNFKLEGKNIRMAYMDVPSSKPNNKAIILFHGKNFNGYYWKDVIPFLNDLGYRVIVPDQLGFGESDKPAIHYSFHQMASNSKMLLDSLGIQKVTVLGHSMGGMLATRFVLMYPTSIDKLVLENPIGLEDYRTFVPYISSDTLYKQELGATYESYRKYQQTYYPFWKPEYEVLVQSQAKALKSPDFPKIAWANALTYQMIYEQPVCYEFKDIKVKTLLIIGTLDRTIVGKAKLNKELQDAHGQYQILGKQVQHQIKGSLLIELPDIGHIPHIQDLAVFKQHVRDFLK